MNQDSKFRMNSDQKADSIGIASLLTPAAIFLAKASRKEHQDY
jgi:hypothetical protein